MVKYMDDNNINEYHYRLWEFHANLLWSRVHYIIVIMAGVYTGWFILFQEFMSDGEYTILYFILAEFLNIFGIMLGYNFLLLAQRDIIHQEFFEDKLPNLFKDIKTNKIATKIRGRYIFQKLLKLCIGSCCYLIIFSAISFLLKQYCEKKISEEEINMMVFFIIFIINTILGYIVFGDQFREKKIFKYDTSSESFATTAVSVVLYFLISSLCLILLTERIDIFLVNLINFPCKEKIISSGLSFAFFLLPIGYLIRILYYIAFRLIKKIEQKHNKKYIAEIDKNEKTLILIISCISLITIAIANEKDYEMAFFITALILGRFFWVDSSICDLLSSIRKIKLKVFVAIIIYWSLSIYVSIMFGQNIILANIVGMTFGFIFGMILYIFINHKNNPSIK